MCANSVINLLQLISFNVTICNNFRTSDFHKVGSDVGQVRWKIFIHHTISPSFLCTYQTLLKVVEIGQSSDKQNWTVF